MVRRSRSADPNHRLAPTLLRYAPNSGAAGVATPVVRQPHPAGPNHRPANNLCPAHAYAWLPVLTSARSSGPYVRKEGAFPLSPACPLASHSRPPGICSPDGSFSSGQDRAGPGVWHPLPLPPPWHLPARWRLLFRARSGRNWGGVPPTPSHMFTANHNVGTVNTCRASLADPFPRPPVS